MSPVAERTDCSKQTVCAHFGIKDVLSRQVIDEQLAEPMTASLDSNTDDIRASLLSFARVHPNVATRGEAIGQYRQLTAQLEAFPSASRSAFASASNVVCKRLADLLHGWMQRELRRSDTPNDASKLLLSMINGLLSMSQRFDLDRRDVDVHEPWIACAVDTFLQDWAILPGSSEFFSLSGNSR